MEREQTVEKEITSSGELILIKVKETHQRIESHE